MTVEQIALIIAGFLAPFATDFMKNLLGWSGRIAQWTSLAVAVVAAAIALAVTGMLSFENPGAFADKAAIVFTIAALVYRQLLKVEPVE